MDTPLEFIATTKGIEYLIAIAFVIAFIAFWQLAYGKGKRRVIRVVLPFLYVAVGISIVSAHCVTTAPALP